MKKFKTSKTLTGFENEKLTKDEMYQLTGGKQSAATGSTKSVCHTDGKTDGDSTGPIIIFVPIVIVVIK
ncbi:MAG: hypothetical protein ABIQ31_08505 [Ferruginibacter sp.]